MARIHILSYDRAIDRRALLQAQSLIEQGHVVTLYAQAGDTNAQDPTFVTRVGAVCDAYACAAPRAFGWRHWLEKNFPDTLRLMLPMLRPLYWMLNGGDPAKLYLALYRETLATMPAADIYIAHDLPMLPVAVEAQRLHGGKLVYDSHEYFCEQEFCRLEKRMWDSVERLHIGRADAVITVNRSIADALQARYGLKAVDVVHNAESLPDEAIPERGRRLHEHFGLPYDARIALYQGGLSHGRNLDVMVEAMRFVPQDVHLVVLGSGPMQARLLNIITRHGLEGRVHLHEAVPQQSLLSYTQSADIGIIPYRDTCLNYRYCTPNKLFEFIAAGLPMVATDLPEITRIVRHYGMGITGDTHNAEHMAALLKDALHPDTRIALREGVLAARSQMNWQKEGAYFVTRIEALL